MSTSRSLSSARTSESAPALVDAWCRLGLAAAALVGYAAAYVVLARETGVLSPWWLLAAGIVIVPHLRPGAWIERLSARQRMALEGAAIALQLVLVLLLASLERDAVLPGALLLAQSWLFAKSRSDGIAALALVVAVLQVIVALVAAPGLASLALLVVQTFVAIGALVLLHARATRNRALRSTFRSAVPDERPERFAPRLRYAALLALCVGVATVALHELASGPSAAEVARRGGARDPLSGGADGTLGEDGGAGGGERGGGATATEYPTGLDYGGALDPGDEGRLLEVRVRPAGGTWGEVAQNLLLKGLDLDTFTASGVELGGDATPELRADGDDGERDGWTRFFDATDEVEVAIRQVPMRIGAQGLAPLLRIEPLSAISLDAVLWSERGLLLAPQPVEESIAYRIRSPRRDLSGRVLRSLSARHPDERFSQLPPESDELGWLAARAVDVTAGSTSDWERVERVVQHFRGEYAYSLGSGFDGLAGLVRFMQTREGFCTYYASAAALLLRTQGVSTRVATGFRVHEWIEEEELYVARARDAHAWFEVWFEEVGWVPFDATPADAVDAAVDALYGAGDEAGAGAWMRDVLEQVDAWSDGRGTFRDVVGAIAALPAALVGSLRAHSLAWIAVALVTVPLVAYLLRRRFGRALERAGVRPPGTTRPQFYYHRLLDALARHGFHKRASQTPLEFAAHVVGSGGAPFAPLSRVTGVLYRTRFGGAELASDDERFIEDFIRDVRERERARE